MSENQSRKAEKGTFVTKPRLIHETSNLFSIARWHTNQRGIEVRTRVIKIEMQPCNEQTASHLQLTGGAEVTRDVIVDTVFG